MERGKGRGGRTLVATYASGYPVALEARAEERDRRALTSMMQYCSLCGLSAYCMLHSPMMPSDRMTLMDVARSLKYSLLVSVCEGATTMESPVCTPSGSKFSMLHTVMQLSLQSRTTSYSISFQPRRSWSIRIWSDTAKALAASSRSSLSLSAGAKSRASYIHK